MGRAKGKSVWSKRRLIGAALLIASLALVAGLWPTLTSRAEIGTAFVARTACVCHNIAGRTLADCRKDFEPGMGIIRVEQDGDLTRASVPLLAATEARWREGWGCLIEPYAPRSSRAVSAIHPPPTTRSPA